MIRIVAISDLHADWWTDGYERFDDVRDSLEAAVDHAIETKADAFVFAGDAGNVGESSHRVAHLLGTAAARLAAVNMPSLWVAGNHDVDEGGSGTSTLTPLRMLEGVTFCARVFESPGVLPVSSGSNTVLFVCLPYPSRARAYDPEAFIAGLPDAHLNAGTVVVVSHLNVPEIESMWGVRPELVRRGSEDAEMARGRRAYFPTEEVARIPARCNRPVAIIQGHYHEPMRLHLGGSTDTTMWVVGSPERLTHGEERKACSFLELRISDGEGIEAERIELESRRVETITWEPGERKGLVYIPGGLIRIRPPAGEDATKLRDFYLQGGAAAVRIEGSTLPTPTAPAEERSQLGENETHRQVVERLTEKLYPAVLELAREEITRIADKEGL